MSGNLIQVNLAHFELIITQSEMQQAFEGFRQHAGRVQQRMPNVIYNQSLKVYPASFAFREDIEVGDKILLPSSALGVLSSLMHRGNKDPMTFCLANIGLVSPKITYCGVLEFVAEQGLCYIPNWMFRMLMFPQPGSPCQISLVPGMKKKNVKAAYFIKLRPHLTKFIDLDNPKAVLEFQLRNFTCLHEGDTITISTFDGKFEIDILEIKPKNEYNAICIVDADVQVDFAPPLDYEDPQTTKNTHNAKFVEEEAKNGVFGGKGVRIDEKKQGVRKGSAIVQEENEYDPRRHRIHRGVRKISNDYAGEGVQISVPVGTKKQ